MWDAANGHTIVHLAKEKKRSPSESSTKSDASFQSVSSSISDISEVSNSSKKSKKNKSNSNGIKKEEKTKGNDITGNIASRSSSSSPATSVKADKGTSSLKPVISTLTSMNSVVSSLKSSQMSASPMTYKLLAHLKKQVQNVTDAELEKCLNTIRRNNKGSLTGLNLDSLAEKVREQLKLQKQKSSNTLGYVKYTGPAWGTVKEDNVDWNKNEQEIVDCVICFEKLSKLNYVQLACKHEFHETCIKQWFKEMTVCPTCKRRCLLQDEYPPLQ